jgi:hypothetical protein
MLLARRRKVLNFKLKAQLWIDFVIGTSNNFMPLIAIALMEDNLKYRFRSLLSDFLVQHYYKQYYAL